MKKFKTLSLVILSTALIVVLVINRQELEFMVNGWTANVEGKNHSLSNSHSHAGSNLNWIDNNLQTEKAEAMEKFRMLTPAEGALYYKENYKQKTYLTDLYIDSVIPKLSCEQILVLKEAYEGIKDTPVADTFSEMFNDVKVSYMDCIKIELDSINNVMYTCFEKDVLKNMEQGIDSMIHNDVKAVVDHSVGGFLGLKKFIPFKAKRAQEKWNEVMDEKKYVAYQQQFIDRYIKLIVNFQKSYFASVTHHDLVEHCTNANASAEISMSDSIIEKIDDYTIDELKDIGKDMARDMAAEVTIEVASGGYATPALIIYNVGIFVYDIGESIYDAIKGNPTNEDKLIESCTNQVKKQVEHTSLKKLRKDMKDVIINSNRLLYNEIDNTLTL